MTGWTAPFIGVPHRDGGCDPATGWDCWGLVAFVLPRVFGAAAPTGAADMAVRCDAARSVLIRTRLFQQGLAAWRRIETPEAGAVAAFGSGEAIVHVGVADGTGCVLHVTPETATVRERIGALRLPPLVGWYLPASGGQPT